MTHRRFRRVSDPSHASTRTGRTSSGIYQEGIDTGHATFESEAPDWERFNTSRLPRHRLVAEASEGVILGWAAVSPVSARPAYSGVVEHSVYVATEARGTGSGRCAAAGLGGIHRA